MLHVSKSNCESRRKERRKMEKEKRHAFGKDIFLLGADKNGIKYWLEAASWDCDWYWGFGYVETYTNNKNPEKAADISSHQHFDGLFLNENICHDFKNLLNDTPLTNEEIWQLLELMKTFYTLQMTAELFNRGSSNITNNVLSSKIKNKQEENRINGELIPLICDEIYKILTPNNNKESEVK